MFEVIGDVKSRIDATLQAALWGSIAAAAAVAGILLLLIALFIWLATHYDVLTACLVLGLLLLIVALAAALAFSLVRRQPARRASERRPPASTQWWLEPAVLAGGLEVVRVLGARRITMLVVVAMASGFLWSSLQRSDHPRRYGGDAPNAGARFSRSGPISG